MPEGTQPTGQPKKIVVNDVAGTPLSAPTPVAQAPVSPMVAPEAISPVEQPMAEPVAVASPPAETIEPSPSEPTPPPAGVPKFGELQPKVDSHPLFSGAKEPKPKNPRRWLKRTIAPVISLVIAAILLYLAVDAGYIKGYSHLPFHFFKAPVATVTPTITPATTSTTTTSPTTTATGSYQTTVNKFISAMRAKDKATADGLESDSFKTLLNKDTGTASFYDYCQKAGLLCVAYFSGTSVDSATSKVQAYKSSSGASGEQVIYSWQQSSSSSSSSSSSQSSLTIAVIPNGTSWLVDLVDAGGSFNATAQ